MVRKLYKTLVFILLLGDHKVGALDQKVVSNFHALHFFLVGLVEWKSN